MHIEFSAHFEPHLKEVIERLQLDAHLFNSFNINGEAITLSGEREELEKILELTPETLAEPTETENYRKVIAIVRAHLR